jgi:1-acyl-sn-glycerol-3-phosphate acyltransferase
VSALPDATTAPARPAGSEPSPAAKFLLSPLARRMEHILAEGHPRRDPDFVRRQIAPVNRLTQYFSPQVEGIENLPATGPVLVVGNHSCLFYMPDVWVAGGAIVERRGVEPPAYILGYDLLFAIPGVSTYLRKIGAIPARNREAEEALAGGGLVLVYPGGDWEACRPWTERNLVEFGRHRGFVRLALRAGVPVVPVVAHGSHDAVVVLTRGEGIARALGLNRLRIKVFPLALGPPLGVTTMLFPPLPLPSAVTLEFLPALDWSGLGAGAAGDPEAVERCFEEVVATMQAALDRLRRENPHPLLRGCSRLAARGLARAGLLPDAR